MQHRLALWLSLTLTLTFLLAGCVVPAPVPATGAAAAPAPVAGDRTGWPEKFVVGFFGGDDADKVLEDNEPFRVYLEQKLGMPVELFTGNSYTAVIEAMRAKRVDGMLVGPFAYVLAVQEAQAEALAVYVGAGAEGSAAQYDENAPAHYLSVIITKKGSGITNLEELKGKDFAFVDPASTSGHLAPKTLLIKNGIDPDKDMKTVFAGSHPTAVMSVWNGTTPAGATFENNLRNLANDKQIEFCAFADGKDAIVRTAEELQATYDACPEGHIAVIGMSDPIPSTPFAVRTELPDSFKSAVKETLLSVKDNPELITQIESWYIDPSTKLGLQQLDEYYNSLRDIAKLLNLDLKALAK